MRLLNLNNSKLVCIEGFFRKVKLPNDISSAITCVRFHPTKPLLSYVSSENGESVILQGDNGYIKSNSFSTKIRGVKIPTNALEWNVCTYTFLIHFIELLLSNSHFVTQVDGTQKVDFVNSSPTEWIDDLLIWKYTYPDECEIMYEEIPLAADGLGKSIVVWNPYNRDVLVTYKKVYYFTYQKKGLRLNLTLDVYRNRIKN